MCVYVPGISLLANIDILSGFEQANQPTLSDVERRNLLNFCIVGGGPTGVEFAAELYDLLQTDIRRHYPALAKIAKINLYDVAPSILGSFDKNLVKYTFFQAFALAATDWIYRYTEKTLAREGTKIHTSRHVEKVEPVSDVLESLNLFRRI